MFTTEQVTEAIEAVVAEKGEDYVYPRGEGCRYGNSDGTPMCIVGHVVAKLDPEAFKRLIYVEQKQLEDIGDSFAVDSPQFMQMVDLEPISALMEAQNWQDMHHTWGAALREYKYRAERDEQQEGDW